mgnify:CR=1 FL=1
MSPFNPRSLAPLFIGTIPIDPPLVLAPMAGQTNYPFRALVRRLGGAGLVVTELVSSNILHNEIRNPQRTTGRFDWRPVEHPIAVQLYGHDPAIMAEAARIVVEYGAPIVDINMGCWVPKVARSGGGAALLRDLPTAAAIVRAVVDAVPVPVTVKVRAGWTRTEITAVEFARAAEGAGAQAVAVHARTADQGFTGSADWSVIRRVKQAVRSIPVIGNGDVVSPADAARMFDETGCDGVMVGRAALGRPWALAHLAHALRTGELLPEPPLPDRAALALEQARTFFAETAHYLPEHVRALELRGMLSKYRLDPPGEHTIRNRLVRASSLEEIEELLEPLSAAYAQMPGLPRA